MAIQSLTDLKALINSTIQDNTTNDISGSDVQTALINAIDTLDSLEGFINVHKANGQTTITAYGSKALARAAVPDDCKKEGVVIAYKISTGWLIEQNLDATAGTWGDDASWQTIGPVSVSQNTNTGGQQLYIGSTKTGNIDDFFNVNSHNNKGDAYADVATARNAVPSDLRALGMTITYLLADGWHTEQFIGSDVADWAINDDWENQDEIKTSEDFDCDLAISDDNKKVVLAVLNGYLKTKNFDSEQVLLTLLEKLNAVSEERMIDANLAIMDEAGNVGLLLLDGHIQTKLFNSNEIDSKIDEKAEETENKVGMFADAQSFDSDLVLADQNGHPVVSFLDGNIKTKKFDSSEINTQELSDIPARVTTLEGSPVYDIDLLYSRLLTAFRAEFAPIGEAEVSYTPKRIIKIFFIGNSVTQDHVGYLPYLFKQLYGDTVDFTIANFYSAGRTIKDYVQDFITGEQSGLYSVAKNTEVWTQENNVYLPDAITRENWNVISIQAYTPRGDAEDISYTPTFVRWLRENSPSPFELAYLMHQNFGTATDQREVRDAAATIIAENPVSLLFAPYFAAKEATKYWAVNGVLSPTGDGTHMREGLPVMITGMHLMQVICDKFGLLNKVLNNGLMMTYAIWETLNVPGANGTPDDSLCTTENYYKAQLCAIQGTKEAKGFLIDCERDMKNSIIN